ncbi:MAG: zinc ribbon domain-containing protein [Oscillospiraceae bacterium]|jgi:hypothetical protein
MTYELFNQGPAAYIPIILVSLLITLVAYGAFPLVFARMRKKTITKKKYNLFCYCVNFLVMVLFVAVNGNSSSGAPYLLWTWVFSMSGIKTLKIRGVLEETQNKNYKNDVSTEVAEVANTTISKDSMIAAAEHPVSEEMPRIRFCRKCGFELIDGSEFCSRCGTAITKER